MDSLTQDRSTGGRLVPTPGTAYTVAEVSQALGVSPHTVRYYERAGLVEVDRSGAGHRVFDEAAVRRLTFLVRMRRSGMGISELRRYVDLVRQGEGTTGARLELMLRHRDAIRAQIRDLELSLAATEYKIATYGGRLGDGRPITDEQED